MTEKTAQQTEVERLDFSKPPPGWAASGTAIIGGRQNEMVEEPDAPDSKARRRPLAIAWQHYKAENDPPGMSSDAHGFAVAGEPIWWVDFRRGDDERRALSRAAAWAWCERRLMLTARLDARGWAGPGDPLDPWPRCLTWSNEQVAEVEGWVRWISTTGQKVARPPALPEVLHG